MSFLRQLISCKKFSYSGSSDGELDLDSGGKNHKNIDFVLKQLMRDFAVTDFAVTDFAYVGSKWFRNSNIYRKRLKLIVGIIEKRLKLFFPYLISIITSMIVKLCFFADFFFEFIF